MAVKPQNTAQLTSVSVMQLDIKQTDVQGLRIETESGLEYDDSFLLKCSRPISIQKGKSLVLQGGFKLMTPQPVDMKDDKNIVASPYHIEWKVEPNIDLLISNNVWAYGSSGSLINPELKLVLFNFGKGIFDAISGTAIATLQFYLVPKLQIKKV